MGCFFVVIVFVCFFAATNMRVWSLNWNLYPLVPNRTHNGLTGLVIQRSLHSAFEEQLCLVATVRLAKPKFIKVRVRSSGALVDIQK